MKLTFFLVALGVASALQWVDFTASDQAMGLEMPYKLAAKAGGNGGGEKTLDCDLKGGIQKLCFQIGGTYLGKTTVTCGDGTVTSCGAALGQGSGGATECWTRSGAERIRGMTCKVQSNYIRSCTALGKDGKVIKAWAAGRSGTVVSALPKINAAKLIGNGVCGNHDYKRFTGVNSPNECAAKCKAAYPACKNVEYTASKACDCDKSTVLCSANSSNSMHKLYTSGWRAAWKTYEITTNPGFDNGKELRALKLRCGWWMDAVQAGFGNPPPAPKNAAFAGGVKNDFQSRNNGDQLRGWVNGPKMAGQGKTLTGHLYYKDQGWGNKKTAVFAQCGSTTKMICPIYQKRGSNVPYVKCNVNLDLSFCKKGDQLKILYRVGGGGGHRFYGKLLSLVVAYKSPLLDDVAFGLTEEFVSPVFEDEIDMPEFVEAQEAEVPVSYTVGGAAIVSFVAVGAYMFGRRNRGEYTALLDA